MGLRLTQIQMRLLSVISKGLRFNSSVLTALNLLNMELNACNSKGVKSTVSTGVVLAAVLQTFCGKQSMKGKRTQIR